MKTYQQTTRTTEPRLVIEYDENTESPREWSNLGYFITVDRNYNSPDQNKTLENIVAETGEEATSREEHMTMIKKRIKDETGETVEAIYPVCKYEHSGVVYRLGVASGFDYSNNGFYIVTDKTRNEIGVKKDKKAIEKFIEAELKTYTQWANGEVYQFALYNEAGEMEDSCGGFYDLESIKEALPEEWQAEDMDEYVR